MGLEPVVFASEAPAGTVHPLPGRVRLDPEHGGHVCYGEMLPRHQAQHLDVGVTEPGERGEHAAGLVAVEHRFVDCGNWSTLHGAQAVLETAPSGAAAPLVSDHPVGNPIHPHQCVLASGDLAEAAPHRQERVGDGVIDRVARHPPAAIVPDRSVAPGVELGEAHLIARTYGARSAPPDAHDKTMPEQRRM